VRGRHGGAGGTAPAPRLRQRVRCGGGGVHSGSAMRRVRAGCAGRSGLSLFLGVVFVSFRSVTAARLPFVRLSWTGGVCFSLASWYPWLCVTVRRCSWLLVVAWKQSSLACAGWERYWREKGAAWSIS